MGYCLINQVQIGSAPVSGEELVGSSRDMEKDWPPIHFRRAVLSDHVMCNLRSSEYQVSPASN